MRFRVVKGFLVILALILGLMVFEVFLRVFSPEPENLAKLKTSTLFLYENKTNATFFYENGPDGFRNTIYLNSNGFRDDDFKVEKPEGVFRIAVLGDSQEEALQVELSDTWQKVLARELSQQLGKRVETYNFGVSGYGTDQQWLTLREKVWQFKPDMVILAFSPNDVGDTYKNKLVVLENGKLHLRKPSERLGGHKIGRLVRQTYLYHLIAKASLRNDLTKRVFDKFRVKILGFPREDKFFLSDAQLQQGPFEVIASQKNPPPEVNLGWEIVRLLIYDMKEEADKNNCAFLVTVNIPRAQVRVSDWEYLRDNFKLDPNASFPFEINEVLKGILQEKSINFYDPREDALLWYQEKGDLHWEHDAHFSVNGNLFMGTKVSEYIIKNELIK